MKRKEIFAHFTLIIFLSISLLFTPTTSRPPASFLKQIFIPRNGKFIRSLFTSKDNVTKTLIALINNEKKSILVAIYYLTCPHIATALQNAHNRGVTVKIVTDAKHVEKCPHTRIFDLNKHNLDIKVYKSDRNGLMHHKFLVFGENIASSSVVSTGSFNFTTGAQKHNRENITVTNIPNTVREYTEEFQDLQRNSESLQTFLKRVNFN